MQWVQLVCYVNHTRKLLVRGYITCEDKSRNYKNCEVHVVFLYEKTQNMPVSALRPAQWTKVTVSDRYRWPIVSIGRS